LAGPATAGKKKLKNEKKLCSATLQSLGVWCPKCTETVCQFCQNWLGRRFLQNAILEMSLTLGVFMKNENRYAQGVLGEVLEF